MNTIKIKCNECGVEFDKNVFEYNRKKKLGKKTFFCSIGCGTKFQIKQRLEKNKSEYYSNPKKCLVCNSTISYERRFENKFCGHSCSAKFNNQKRKVIKQCLFCNKEFNPLRGNVGKFCTQKCSASYRKQQVINLINSGNYKPKSTQTRALKNFLIETRGYKCESCGLSEWLNQKIVLTLEHKDGDATNNKLCNVQLLCWNCHSLTPTFCGKNKNGTRHWRKERYLPVSSNGKTPSS